jgi:hypothetical protein
MEKRNGQNRSPQFSEKPQDSESEVGNRSLGTISRISPEYGANEITVGREDSDQSDTTISRQQPGDGVSGKIVGQLIDENEKQLAYHQQQIELINARIEELKRIPEKLTE